MIPESTLCWKEERQGPQLVSHDVLKETHLELTLLSRAGHSAALLAVVYSSCGHYIRNSGTNSLMSVPPLALPPKAGSWAGPSGHSFSPRCWSHSKVTFPILLPAGLRGRAIHQRQGILVGLKSTLQAVRKDYSLAAVFLVGHPVSLG